MIVIRCKRKAISASIGLSLRAHLPLSIACLALLTTQHTALAGNLDNLTYFHIGPQALDKALLEFGKQAHVQLMFASNFAIGQARTRALIGNYTDRQALVDLLKGSNLQFVEHGNTVEIEAAPAVSKPSNGEAGQLGGVKGRGARAPLPGSPATTPDPQQARSQGNIKAPKLQEVVVTGTHIFGVEPISPVITITSEDIRDSGLPDIASVIRAMPEDFGGGENPGVVGVVGSINGGDAESGVSTANLRGLGPLNTLVLLDGERLPGNGLDGSVDLSSIPTAAVERVDIEPDGASAIYGSDAVGGVVNIVLRKNYNGEQTNAYLDGSADGGGLVQRYSQLVGRASESGGLMLGYQFQRESPVTAGERAVSQTEGDGSFLQPYHADHSVFLAGHYQLTSDLAAHVEGVYNHSTTVNREDDINENASLNQYTSAAGLTFKIDSDRTLKLDFSDAGARDDVNLSAVEPQTPPTVEDARTSETGLRLVAQGELVRLPGARVIRAAAGVGYRKSNITVPNIAPETGSATPSKFEAQRTVKDAFMEVNIPIVPASEGRYGLERMSVNLADRYSDYSDFGSSTSPKIGLAYSPAQGLTISETWGRSFLAPTLFDTYGESQALILRGRGFGLQPGTEVLETDGSNPDLKPQTATSWSTSIRWVPPWLQGLNGNLTYYDIDFHNRVNSPILNNALAFNPMFSPFVTLNPSAALVNDTLSSVSVVDNFFGLPTNAAAFTAVVDDELQNITEQKIHGADLSVGYDRGFEWGDINLNAAGSWLRFDQLLLAGSVPESIAGTIFEPPKFKMRDTVGFTRENWGASIYVNYVSGELNTETQPASHVGAWTTIDGQVRYTRNEASGASRGMQLRVSVLNMMNHFPPSIPASSTDPPGIGFDAANYSAIGRTYALDVSVDW